jgi:hypothetical protein
VLEGKSGSRHATTRRFPRGNVADSWLSFKGIASLKEGKSVCAPDAAGVGRKALAVAIAAASAATTRDSDRPVAR